jgi:hypothetical protein
MPRLGVFATVGTIVLSMAACATHQQVLQNKEDMLAAAGFTLRPADTPERRHMLASLPPHRFVRRDERNRVIYLYADPTVCSCLYVGDEKAYGTYRQDVLARHIANEQAISAEINYDRGWQWEPGAWVQRRDTPNRLASRMTCCARGWCSRSPRKPDAPRPGQHKHGAILVGPGIYGSRSASGQRSLSAGYRARRRAGNLSAALRVA